MSSDGFPFSVAQQKALISAELNSTLLVQFLFGIYTGLFPAVLYIYTRKENRTQSRDRIVIGIVTALYLSTLLWLLSNWLFTSIIFCKSVATRVTIFLESVDGYMPAGEDILGDVASFVVFLFADGLLVWRCFHACGRSIRRSLLPMVLLIVETALIVSALAYNGLISTNPNFDTTQASGIANRLNAAVLISVATTSLVSTAVICLRIRPHTSHSSPSKKHYQTIINILIESSALYTIIALFMAILSFANTGSVDSSLTVILITEYVGAISQIVSGLAPTLMIAALVVSSSHDSGSQVSSPHIPTDLISGAYQPSNAKTENVVSDLEMQRSGSFSVGERESEEIQVVPGDDHGLDDDGEVRLKTIA
ncbi:hypothetical protein CPC08DRAFT_714555 [Agrocybe pediades]|nr:hypothetical protein CPC08DRAFT_714555 [Agrocybe pediades]